MGKFSRYLMLTPAYADQMVRELADEMGVDILAVNFTFANGDPERMDVVTYGTQEQADALGFRFGFEQTP